MGEIGTKQNNPFIRKGFWLWLVLATLVTGCANIPPAPSDATATLGPTLTLTSSPLPTETTTPTLLPTNTALPGSDEATFVRENYPDYSAVAPGEKFVKTWEVKNIGTSTWTSAYSLVLETIPQNESLNSPARLAFPQDTPPGETVPLSINLTAPANPGTYAVYWSLENDRQETFTVDGGRIWVIVMVCAEGTPCSPPASGGSASVSANNISASLTNFTYDDHSATVSFCMTVPDRHYALGSPAPSLLIDGQPVLFLSGGSIPPWGCYEMKYQTSLAEIEQAQSIILSIDTSLRMSPPPGDPDAACQSARPGLIQQYPGLDFQCHFSGAGYCTDLQLPAGMTATQAQEIIFDAIEGAIYGPWVLRIKG